MKILPTTALSLLFCISSSGSSAVLAQDLVEAFMLTEGTDGFTGNLTVGADFGAGLASPGDLDGDGIPEIAVGAPGDLDAGAPAGGEVYVLFPSADGTIRSFTRIAEGVGGFTGGLARGDRFGSALELIGDLNADGRPELVVSAPLHDDGSGPYGAIWILSLDATGAVVAQSKIGPNSGAFGGLVDGPDAFGSSLAPIGDLDGDGILELAVGAEDDGDGGTSSGAVWILFLNANGMVRSELKLGANTPGLVGSISSFHRFGSALAAPGDIDGDGAVDLVVGARRDGSGSLRVLFLDASGAVRSMTTIKAGAGGFPFSLAFGDEFGSSVTTLDDMDGDGRRELVVGAPLHAGFEAWGALWVLDLRGDGTVEQAAELNDGHPLLSVREGRDELGAAARAVSGARSDWLIVGSPNASAPATSFSGAIWLLQVSDGDPTAAFSAASPTLGAAPLSVDFLDASSGAGSLAWQWDFGDGSTSTLASPSHVYTQPGTYSVVLRVTNASGSATDVERDLIVAVTAASVAERNGSGVNPDVLDALGAPILGADWSATVSATGATGLSFLLAYERPLAGISTVFGEVLVDPSSPLLALDAELLVGGLATHSEAIPNDLSIAGGTASVQALLNGSGQLTNALDLVFGL